MKFKEYRLSWFAASVLFISMIVAGCSTNSTVQDPIVDLVTELQKASNELLKNTTSLTPGKPVISTTLVSIDNMQQSSTFGRQVSEVFSTSLLRKGIQVVDLRMRESVFVREGTGELVLSRELRHLSKSYDAQAVLAGTYSVGGKYLYVNVRIIQTADNVVLGSHNFSLPLNSDIRSMLNQRR